MKNILKGLIALLLVGMFIPSVIGTYNASYTVGDIDDIMIDLVGTGASEVKDDMPTIVDLGILYIIFLLLASAISMMVIAVLVIPKKLKPKTKF